MEKVYTKEVTFELLLQEHCRHNKDYVPKAWGKVWEMAAARRSLAAYGETAT